MHSNHASVVSGLRADILRFEGFKSANETSNDLGLGPITFSFPTPSFPTGAVHEFIPATSADTGSMNGFVASLLGLLAGNSGVILWVSLSQSLFPPALRSFGIQPDRVLFVQPKNDQEALWTIEEALKCGALTAVVGETKDFDFTVSRRFQLAVEQSGVTGFMLRRHGDKLNPSASVCRWRIRSHKSEQFEGIPGIGFPCWRVELLKVRNGKPGAWDVQWVHNRFSFSFPDSDIHHLPKQSIG